MERRPETESRVTQLPVEVRAAGGSSRRIGGYAAVFGVPSRNLGGFTEQLDNRVFNKSEGDGWAGVAAKFNHNDQMLLGTTRSGTLRLSIDNRGLNYTVELPECRSDVLELVSRGDIASSSFAFQCFEDDWSTTESGFPLRTLRSVRLMDVSPVIDPAYTSTSAGLRSLARHVGAPFEDVAEKAQRNELRSFFVRSDGPRIETRTKPTLAERRVQLMRLRYPGGKGPPVGRDGRQALLEILAKRWPHEPRSGRQAMAEIMGKRWTTEDLTGWQ